MGQILTAVGALDADAETALGAEVEIPTLEGKIPFTIKEGTQPGDVLRVRGKGIPYLNGRGTGDLLLKIVVEVPKNLTKEQKKLLKEFDAATGDKQYQKRKSFFDKLKKGFNQDKTTATLLDSGGFLCKRRLLCAMYIDKTIILI